MFRQLAIKSTVRSAVYRPVVSVSRNYSIMDSAKEALKNVNKKMGEVAAEGMEKAQQATPSAEELKQKAQDGMERVQNATPSAEELKQKAQDGMEKVQNATPSSEELKQKAQDGADAVYENTPSASEMRKNTSETVSNGTKTLDRNSPDFKDIKKAGKKAKETAESKIDEGKEHAKEAGIDVSGAYESAKKMMNNATETISETASTVNKKVGKAAAAGMESIENSIPSTEQNPSKHTKQYAKADAHNRAVDRVRENSEGYKNLRDKGSKVESEQCRPDDAV